MNNFKVSTILFSIALTISDTNAVLAEGQLAGEFYEKALVAHRNHEDATAILELKNAIQQNPNYVTAYLLLGEIYLQQKSLSEAEVLIRSRSQLKFS
jgi:Tfp pilus assembly protein PilF